MLSLLTPSPLSSIRNSVSCLLHCTIIAENRLPTFSEWGSNALAALLLSPFGPYKVTLVHHVKWWPRLGDGWRESYTKFSTSWYKNDAHAQLGYFARTKQSYGTRGRNEKKYRLMVIMEKGCVYNKLRNKCGKRDRNMKIWWIFVLDHFLGYGQWHDKNLLWVVTIYNWFVKAFWSGDEWRPVFRMI